MMDHSKRELELKFEGEPSVLEALAADPVIEARSSVASTATLRSTYFDTADHRLRRARISLRVRDHGGRFTQTVKLETGCDGGVSNPLEVEHQAPDGRLDLELIGDAAILRRIRKALDGAAPQPIFRIETTRAIRRLESQEGRVDLAIDRSVAQAGGREEAFGEIEVELVSGSPLALMTTAREILGSYHIAPSRLTKADRGYRLLMPEEAPPPASETAGPNLDAGMTCGEAAAAIVRNAGERIVRQRGEVLATGDSEAVHRLRVALRQLRAAVKAFGPLLEEEQAKAVDGQARWLARRVGELRDAHVLRSDIVASPAKAFGRGRSEVRALRRVLARHEASAAKRTREALKDQAWWDLQIMLVAWPPVLQADPKLAEPVRRFAGKALDRAWRRVAKRGKRIDKLDVEERHDLRKALKSLRYSIEFFGPLYAEDDARPFVKRLKALQDCFGYVNDVAMAERIGAIVGRYGSGDSEAEIVAGFVLGWHAARVEGAWGEAKRGWRKLSERDRFW